MSELEIEILEKWLGDESFQNWATKQNPTDVSMWDKYLVENDQYQELAEYGKTAVLHLQVKLKLEDQSKAQAALERLKYAMVRTKQVDQAKVVPLWRRPWMVASSIVLLLAFGFWTYTSSVEYSSTIVYATQDFKEEFDLSDGSKVILNKYSEISFVKEKPRQVSLVGEGFFKVKGKYETGQTFQVNTTDLLITVLGTEFNVNSRDERTRVYLDKGKVTLSMEGQEMKVIEMEPGELVSYSKKQNRILINQPSKALENTAWKEDVILFEEVTLSEVLTVISNVYTIQFESDDSFPGTRIFSGSLPGDRIDITIQTLAELYDLDFIAQGETVYQIKMKE